MTTEESLAARIFQLLAQGKAARSRCGDSLIELLQPLVQGGVIVEERFGAGRCLVVRDPGALQAFARARFPNAATPEGAAGRIAGVARFRDSKALASDTAQIVCVRAWRNDALTKNGQPTEAAPATAQHGAFSFLLCPGSAYALSGTCALAENPVVFTEFERLQLPAGLVIYGQGRISNRLLNWLAGMTSPQFNLLHLPDYDPVGLSEFQRLYGRLGKRVHLYIPADFGERFLRFSNPSLLAHPNSRALLAGLRRTGALEIRPVLQLIDQHNAGLEQEALLV
jgi:hypothetical protein